MGGALVEGPDGPVDGRLSRRRPLAVLAALAMAGDRGLTRDRLIGLLWPEADTPHARHSLSDVLHSIHRNLGHAVTLAAGDVVRLNDAAIETDAVAFDRAAERGDVDQTVALYTGPFMDGFYVSESPAFSEWQDSERRRLASRYAEALEHLARRAEMRRDPAEAAGWWGRRLELDPYRTHAALALANALTESGERAAALRVLMDHATAVRNGLDLDPDPAIERAIERVRSPTPSSVTPPDSKTNPKIRPALPALAELPWSGAAGAGWAAASATGKKGLARRPLPALRPLGLVAAMLIVAGVAWEKFPSSDRSRSLIGQGVLQRGDRVLLADFANRTADSTLADAVREGMRALLTNPTLIRLIDLATVREGLERMGRPPDGPLDEPVARELALREGAPVLVTGEVSRLGTGYQLTARVVGSADGRELLMERVTADGEAGVIAALGRLGTRVRNRIGESVKGATALPLLERVSTPSLPALRAYSGAVRASSNPQAIALLDQAIALDTAFASAYRLRAIALRHVGRPHEAHEAIELAYQYRERLPELERLLVEVTYHGIHLQAQSLEAALLRLLTLDPLHPFGLGNLADLRLGQHRFAEAESLAMLALTVSPPAAIPYWNALEAQLAQGHDSAAHRLLASAPPGVQRELEVNVWLAVRNWDRAETATARWENGFYRRALKALHGSLSPGQRPLNSELTWWPLRLLRYTGDTARTLRAVEAWRARVGFDTLPATARHYWILIPTLAEAGRIEDARRLLDEWRSLAPDDPRHRSDEDWSLGAIAFAEARFDSAAAAFLRWHRGPMMEGVHLQNRGLFEAATTFDRAGHTDTALVLYERALAIRSLGAVQYEATWYPLALRRLGQIHASLGHRGQAAEYYARFFNLWRDSDPDLQPQVTAVRGALARLTGEPRN